MPSIPVVFGLIAFAGVFLFFLGIGQMRRSAGGAEDFQARLAAYGVTTTAGAQTLPPATGLRDTINLLSQPAADRMGRGDVKKGKPSVAEQLQRADLKLRPSEYFMIQLGSGALVGLIGFWRWGPLFALLFFAGYLIPGVYVKYRIGQRLKKFNAQLGDTLTLLSNALKAGYSFAQAIDTVAKNAVPPIGDEFGRAVREMNLGGSPDEALSNITKRIASQDFDLVATAYSIHRTVGGNLAEILDNIAYTIRERVRIKGEIQTLTAGARVGHHHHRAADLARNVHVLRHAHLLPADVRQHHRVDPARDRWIHDLHRQPDHPPHRGDRGLVHEHHHDPGVRRRGRRADDLHRPRPHSIVQHCPDRAAAALRVRRREAADGGGDRAPAAVQRARPAPVDRAPRVPAVPLPAAVA